MTVRQSSYTQARKMSEYYTYKKQNYSCKKCKWEGIGKQTVDEWYSWEGLEIFCPKCYHLLGLILFPTFDDVLKFGTKKEKNDARQRQQFLDCVDASRLKSEEQLPEIESDKIVITLREEETVEGKNEYIVLYWNEKEIWREIRTYEYYDRYIELGQILQKKYGSRLFDFEAEETMYFCGDSLTGFDEVRAFRKSLQTNKHKKKLK